MKAPTIALCIPAYNTEPHLPRLLASAAAQKVPFAEIIVCDDASSDRTGEVARSFGARVVVNPVNRGCSASKNAALSVATSEWVHFHDADDALLPDFTERAAAWASSSAAPDVVLFGYEYRDDATCALIDTKRYDDDALRADALRYCIRTQVAAICGIYRRSKLIQVGGYDTDAEILYNEDVAFHCKLALAGFTFRADPAVTLVNYRMGSSMSGSNALKCLRAQYHVMKRVAAAAPAAYAEEIRDRLWHVAAGLASYRDWETVDAALALAGKLSREIPSGQSAVMKALSRVVKPKAAFRIRESLIRAFKPRLRRGM